MPALMSCQNSKCNFPGPLGFTDPGVGGITHFYHDGCPGSYYVDGQYYDTKKEAWLAVRPRLVRERADSIWLQAFDAEILEENFKKSQKLFKQWRESWD